MSVFGEAKKIFVNSSVTITNLNMTTLLFVDDLAISKSKYSLTNHYINLLHSASESMVLYHNVNSCNYYEFNVSLRSANTTISGMDIYNNKLDDLTKNNVLVFVNGIKLLNSEFQVASSKSIIIYTPDNTRQISNIIIYTSKKLNYLKQISGEELQNNHNEIEIKDYDNNRYMLFLNGFIVKYDCVQKLLDRIKLNVSIQTQDILEIYKLPSDTNTNIFEAIPGYISYGPVDKYRKDIPILCNAKIKFDQPLRLIVDNIREGFYLHSNKTNDSGELMILNDDYDLFEVHAIVIHSFSNNYLDSGEYYLTVPNAKSILKYVSEYDLGGKLFPELLGIFQKVLLDENYDSLKRLRDIRNINKVPSSNLSALINFLGLNLKINNISDNKKRRLLEELTSFYKIVGTKASYNFYNFTTENSSIVNIEQLFTPIKDSDAEGSLIRRYVDFRTAEELGAIKKQEYRIPMIDYGQVDEIANFTDSFTNTPNSKGILENNERPYIQNRENTVYILDSNGKIIETLKQIDTNHYLTNPTKGPNKPTEDYGWIVAKNPSYTSFESATDFIDYGQVSEKIKGEWVSWYEWDRTNVKNWYPTNHVNLSVNFPAELDYDEFIKDLLPKFYDIASTVVYIHSIIQVYGFGTSNKILAPNTNSISVLGTPIHNTIEYCFTNDLLRQPDKHWERATPSYIPDIEVSACPNIHVPADIPTCDGIVIKDVDYLVIKYVWDKGTDLDTHTRITNTSLDILTNRAFGYYAGHGASNAFIPSDTDTETCLCAWSGDNTSTATEGQLGQSEQIMINCYNMRYGEYSQYLPTEIEFELRCAWWNTPGGNAGHIYIVVDGYKNGTMEYISRQSGFRNVDGTYIGTQEAEIFNIDKSNRITDTIGDIPSANCNVKVVAKLYYNKLTKMARIVVIPKQDS